MPYNILVVDDSASMRKVIMKSIRMTRIGEIDFFEAGHGEEALLVIKDKWIDLVFSDVNMPVMDGFAFAKRLLENELTKTTPVIIVTSGVAAESNPKAQLSNIKHIVYKPFRPEVIREIIINTLRLEVSEDDDDSGFEGADF